MKIEQYSGDEASSSSSSFSNKSQKFYTHENKPFQIQYLKIKKLGHHHHNHSFIRSKQNLVRQIQNMAAENEQMCMMNSQSNPKSIFKIINKNQNLASKISRKIKDLTNAQTNAKSIFRSQQIVIQQQYYQQQPTIQKTHYSGNNKQEAIVKEISYKQSYNEQMQASEPATVINNLKKGFKVYVQTSKQQQYAELLRRLFPFLNSSFHQQQQQQQIAKYLMQHLKYKNFLSCLNEQMTSSSSPLQQQAAKITDEQLCASKNNKVIRPIIIYQEKQ